MGRLVAIQAWALFFFFCVYPWYCLMESFQDIFRKCLLSSHLSELAGSSELWSASSTKPMQEVPPAKSSETFPNILGLVYMHWAAVFKKLKMNMITKQKPLLYVCSHFR